MTSPRSRRWFQLSLKSLFQLTLLVATFLAGYSLADRRADTERRSAQQANELRIKAERELLETRAQLEQQIGWQRFQLVPPASRW